MSKPVAILVVAAIVLYGCSGNIEQEAVRSIEIGTYRAEVEEVLGEPVASEQTNVGVIHTYSFDVDADESDSLPDDYGGCVGACAMAYMLILPATVIVDASGVFDEERQLYVVYGPDNRVVELARTVPEGTSSEDAILRQRQWREESAERRLITLGQAENGNPEAMYQYANVLSINEQSERLRWYCRAAQAGHAKAQYTLGNYYRLGLVHIEQDVILAYAWYTLSFEGGHATAEEHRARLSQEMTPSQIAEAERLVVEWEPNRAECEIYSDETHAP